MRADWVSPFWQAQCLPDLWDVCGISCASLTVWHRRALRQTGNAYVTGAMPDKDSAAGLLVIASRCYRDGRALFVPGRDKSLREAVASVHKALRGLHWSTVDAACREYVDVCGRTADRFTACGGKPCAVPEEWHLVAMLSGGRADKLDAAWDTPYAIARCLFDARAEASGDGSIMSERAQEMADNWSDYKDREGVETLKIA